MINKKEIIEQTLTKANELASTVKKLSENNFTDADLKDAVKQVIEESLSTDTIESDSKKITDSNDALLEMDYDLGSSLEDSLDVEDLEDLGSDTSSSLDIGGLDGLDAEVQDSDDVAMDLTNLGDEELKSALKVFKKNPNTTVTIDDNITKLKDNESGEEYVIVKEGNVNKKMKLVTMENNFSEKEETIYEIVLEDDSKPSKPNNRQRPSKRSVNESKNETIYEIVLEDDSQLDEAFTQAWKHKAPKYDGTSTAKRTKKFGSTDPFSVKAPKWQGDSAKKRTSRARGNGNTINDMGKSDNIFNKKSKKESISRAKVEQIIRENKALKNKVNSFGEKMPQFEGQLQDMALYNANLTYALKLISENSTTALEKQDIITRFENVDNTNDAKKLYQTISSELKQHAPTLGGALKESVQGKSSIVINESQAGVQNVELSRMKKLMNY